MAELLEYIQTQKINDIFKYLNENNNINYVNSDQENAFILSIKNKMQNVSHLLLKDELLNLEQVDNDHNTSLILSIQNGYPDLALEILNRGFKNINQINANNECALYLSIKHNYNEVVNTLLTIQNIDLNFIDHQKNSILMNLIIYSKDFIHMDLFKKTFININYVNPISQENALLMATKQNNPELAIKLIECGASIDYINDKQENVYLLAVEYQYSSILKKIFELNNSNNTVLDLKDLYASKNNVYFYALKTNNESLCKNIILKTKFNFEIIHKDNTLLLEALRLNMFSLAYIIIKYGNAGFIQYINRDNEDALYLILKKREYHLALEIFEKGYYNINVQYRNTSLMFLAIESNIENICLKILNDNIHTVDLNIYYQSESLFNYALKHNMKKLALKLIHCIDDNHLNHINNNSDNALFICIHLEYYDVIEKILDNKNINVNVLNQYKDNALILLLYKQQYVLAEKLLMRSDIEKYHKTPNNICALDIIYQNNVPYLKKYFNDLNH